MTDIKAVLTSGQSLSLGVQPDATQTVISLPPAEHANAQAMNEDGTFVDLDLSPSTPLPSRNRQRPDLSMGARLAEAFPSQFWGMMTVGKGGKTIAELSKGGSTGKFEEMVAAVNACFAAAAALSKTFVVDSFHWIQGEADQAVKTGVGNYMTLADTLVADYSAAFTAATGQPATWPFIMSQVNSWTVYKGAPQVPLAQLALARTRPRFFLVGAQYQLPYDVDPHLSNAGYYYLGELHARAQVSIDNTGDWKPVAPLAAGGGIAVVGNTLVVTFDVPTPPLVLDSTLLPRAPDFGFSLANTASSIISISVTGPTEVTIILDKPVTEGGATLGYGVNTIAEDRTGNLHDSDPSVSVHDGFPLPNWCCQFQDPIPTVAPPPTTFRRLFKVVEKFLVVGGVPTRLWQRPEQVAGISAFGDTDFGDTRFY